MKKYITVDCYNGKYSVSSYGYSTEYKEWEQNLLNKYLNQDNTEQIRNFGNIVSDYDKQIKELLFKKGKNELQLQIIEYSEEVKTKNKDIQEYISNLKKSNKLNVWYNNERKYFPEDETIENGTYKMNICVYTLTNYRDKSIEYYQVRYWFGLNEILTKNSNYNSKRIQSVEKKFRGNEKDQMEKYIKGRKLHYSKYFEEEQPPVPIDLAYYIKKHGIALEGYKVETKVEAKE